MDVRSPTVDAKSAASSDRFDRSDRIVALDVVRAIALFGVLAVNIDTQFAVSPFARFVANAPAGGGRWNDLAETVIASGLEERPLIVFSFLFGMGLATQHAHARRAGRPFTPMLIRRLAFLMALGVLHFALVWVGDVLTLYAAVALIAAPLMRLPRRALVAVAVVFFVVSALPLPWPPPFASAEEMRAHVEAARQIYAHGSYADIVAYRLHEARPALAIMMWSIPRTLGLFALGATIDATWLQNASRRELALGGAVALAVGSAARWVGPDALRGIARNAALEWSEVAIALGATALLFVAADRAKERLGALAVIGRMTLTSYLCESVVLGFVFYGYGLGLFDRVGHAAGLVLALVLFALQTVFAVLWLRRYSFGPFEWAWRVFTHGGARDALARARK